MAANNEAKPDPSWLGRLTQDFSAVIAKWFRREDIQAAAADEEPAASKIEVASDLPEKDIPVMLEQFDLCFHSRGGELKNRLQTAKVAGLYNRLDRKGRERFIKHILGRPEYGSDPMKLREGGAKIASAVPEELQSSINEFNKLQENPRDVFLRQILAFEEGFRILIEMRGIVLDLKDPALDGLKSDLSRILKSWIDVGMLTLKRIQDTPDCARIVARLPQYERVHKIPMDDPASASEAVQRRLRDEDRRVYAYMHPLMPDDPVTFVQVAFTEGLEGNIQNILNSTTPVPRAKQDTAMFYSINNQHGLDEISGLGKYLIPEAKNDILASAPHIKQFSTLSPIPGFRNWLEGELSRGNDSMLRPEDRKVITKWARDKGAPRKISVAQGLRSILADAWWENAEASQRLKPILEHACAHYLYTEKAEDGKKALNRVLNLHVGQGGARLERINWRGDTSPNGIKESFGIMVNYAYPTDDQERDRNYDNYAKEGTIPIGKQVEQLLQPEPEGFRGVAHRLNQMLPWTHRHISSAEGIDTRLA